MLTKEHLLCLARFNSSDAMGRALSTARWPGHDNIRLGMDPEDHAGKVMFGWRLAKDRFYYRLA